MLNREEIKQHITEALSDLGLRDQEIEAISISLANGPMPVSTLADYLGMSTPNAYKVIAKIEHAGLSKFSQTKKRGQLFSVLPPNILSEKLSELQRQIKQRTETFQDFLPELLANYQQGDLPSRVKVLQGADQFEAATNRMFDEANGSLNFFGSVTDFIKYVSPKRFEKMTVDRVRRKITLRSIMLASPEAEILALAPKQELREVRIFKGATPFTTSFQLSQSQIILWQPHAAMAIVIEDEYLVKMFLSMFEALWNVSK